jgi:hypothetical protein
MAGLVVTVRIYTRIQAGMSRSSSSHCRGGEGGGGIGLFLHQCRRPNNCRGQFFGHVNSENDDDDDDDEEEDGAYGELFLFDGKMKRDSDTTVR